jgi:photosystem II stability/assembly factor-like uncharacterized protein
MKRFLILAVLTVCLPCPAQGAESAALANALLARIPARSLGPGSMGGRVVDVEVAERDRRLMYVAAATGGLWKSADGGASWKPVFDQQGCLCLGDVAIAPSNPDVVWVGTGEANLLRSVSCGNGVYRTTDGGKTWQHLGLKETRHIGRIAVHPKDPDVAWVAALGHAWGPNKERGLYRTTDGGKTWQQVKFLDEDTGFIDVAVDPADPDILYASAYTVKRDAFSGMPPRLQFGPKAGLYRSGDGGRTWERMTEGLPDRSMGRCGLAVWSKDPRVVYAVIQTDRTLSTPPGQPAREGSAAETGGIFRSEDKGKTWKKLNDLCPLPFYYGQIRIDPNDDKRIYVLGVSFYASEDGGRTFKAGARGTHPDQHALWIDPADSTHLLLGNDGGLYESKDRGASWEMHRGLSIGQYYAIAVDLSRPYRIFGGLQDNGVWYGPSATASPEGILASDWKRLLGNDGFRCAVDPQDLDTVYCETQYGNLQRLSLKGGGKGRSIKPSPPPGEPAYRFNWNTPLLLSPHDPKTLYFGGNFLFRSTDRSGSWETISGDLTRGTDATTADTGHSLTAVAESPLKAGLLWTGSDDGKLYVSRDAGKVWIDQSAKLPGLPPERWITCIECSHHAEGTAYVSVDRHRNDDLRPHLFRSTDHGRTWTSIAGDLPAEGPVHVIRESSKNKDLLFAGTEFGLFASLDAGKHWQRMTNGVPAAVTVHDLVIHPRERELVIGTHGRGIYVADIGPLEETNPEILAADAVLFTIRATLARALRDPEKPADSGPFRGVNPPTGAVIWYHLAKEAAGPVTLTVTGADGKELAKLTGPREGGMHRVVWDLRAAGAKDLVAPGEYTITLHGGTQPQRRTVKIEPAP